MMREELIRSAAAGGPVPEGLSLPEQLAWQALGLLYARARLGQVTPEIGSAEKRRILHAMRREQEVWAFAEKLADHRWRVLRDTEAAVTAVRKNPTPENALRLCDVLDGLEEWEETT